MHRRLTDSGTVVEVAQVELGDAPAVLIKITPPEGSRTALALPVDVAEALMDGLMIETVK